MPTACPPARCEGYSLPEGDGTARNRKGLRRAMRLLGEAGWQVENGRLVNADGTPLRLTVLLQQDGLIAQASAMMDIYARALDRLGITLNVESVDKAQYAEREAQYDFDLTMMRRSLSLSPGNEQMFYWGSDGVDAPGSRNLMGMRSQAAEAMIRTMLGARDRAGLRRRHPRARPDTDGGALRDPGASIQRRSYCPQGAVALS